MLNIIMHAYSKNLIKHGNREQGIGSREQGIRNKNQNKKLEIGNRI